MSSQWWSASAHWYRRAIYKQANMLVLDEASALDSSTEWAVMDAVEALSKQLTIGDCSSPQHSSTL